MLIQNPERLAFGAGDLQKLRFQPGLAHRALPGVRVQIERTALAASMARPFPLIDRRRDPVNLQQAGQRETSRAGADDGNVLRRVFGHMAVIGPQPSAAVRKICDP